LIDGRYLKASSGLHNPFNLKLKACLYLPALLASPSVMPTAMHKIVAYTVYLVPDPKLLFTDPDPK